MIDYYGLPGDFPGAKQAAGEPITARRAALLERAMTEELGNPLPPETLRRFIPHVSMHEFEGLLFSRPDRIAEVLMDDGPLPRLREIRGSFQTPEDIDDGPTTAPSKRLLAHFPRYKKRVDGPSITEAIGLPVIRRECPLFDAWLTRLESLEPLEP